MAVESGLYVENRSKPCARAVKRKMMILIHIDWAGTEEQLKELDKGYKIAAEETEGIDFKGRLTPWNKKYHYTYVLKADDITKFHKFGEYFFSENTRDRSLMTHGEYEFYS